jgi:hypothetical protein
MVLLVAAANRIRILYPIPLVLADPAISLIPGLPSLELDPNLVFILFLPPIIQLAAYDTPIRDFRTNLRSISLLAIGLVLATTVVVAVIAHASFHSGIVSLASALALETSFPYRDVIVFITFSVILVTLVFQGLSLPFLIRWLHVVDDGGSDREETKARLKIALAAQARLQELANSDHIHPEWVEKLNHRYEARIRRFSTRYTSQQDENDKERFTTFTHLEQDLLEAEQTSLVQLRNDNLINDKVLRRVQRDIDLEWLRLQDEYVHSNCVISL